MKKKPKFLYMEVTRDKYELPVAVADSPAELSKMVGTKATTISQQICIKKSENKWCKFLKISMESEVLD